MADYRERLTAPASWWMAAVVFGGICGWIMVVAADPMWGAVAAASGTTVAGTLVWLYGGLTVRAGREGLRVANAFLPASAIGSATALDRPAFRANLGPGADARAWLRTRPYIDGGVRIGVQDADDPTPYWLVSCRRPQEVVAALGVGVGHTDSMGEEGTSE